jgi:hypothetical protein
MDGYHLGVTMPDNHRSTHFSHIYSNASKIIAAEDEITIIFGIREDPARPEQLLEQAAVVMTPMAAKLLAQRLQSIVDPAEPESGAPIALQPAGYSNLENAIRLAVEARATVLPAR